jgi:Ca2+-binding RTX toxin-like protein
VIWSWATIKAKLYAGTAGIDVVRGSTSSDTIAGGAGADTLNGAAGDDNIDGGADSDLLYGEVGNDTLSGGLGNDSLDGAAGNDTLDGGSGNDTLVGGTGNNTYQFGKGDGQDLIQFSQDTTVGKLSTFQLKAGVTPAEVQLRKVPDNSLGGATGALEISILGTTDKVVVNGFFYGNDPVNLYNGVQQIRFADGLVWNLSTIVSKASGGSSARAPLVQLSSIGGFDPSREGDVTQSPAASVDEGWLSTSSRLGTAGQRKHHHGNGIEPDHAGSLERMRTHDVRLPATLLSERFESSAGRTSLPSKAHDLVSAMAAFSPPASGHLRPPRAFDDALPTLAITDWVP